MSIEKQLLQEEGSRSAAYQDHLGFWTIGVGRLIDARKPGAGLSEDEQMYLLGNDLARIRTELDRAIPWWTSLNEARQAVLIGMAFQLGVAGLLGFKNTLAAIQTGQYPKAQQGMMLSKWATQTPGRAKRMAVQMLTGEWQPKTGFSLP